MPGGAPVPYVMNAKDVCEFLRLGGDSDEAERLRPHREKGLKATKYTKEVLYLLPDVIAYAQSRSALHATSSRKTAALIRTSGRFFNAD